MSLPPAPDGADWIGLSDLDLPVGDAVSWATLPSCGAVVLFSGTARDHSAGRVGVEVLEYEAYDEQVAPRLVLLAESLRRRWPDLGRLALWHRTGVVPIGGSSVVVVASAPHRADAFDAARVAIDTLKATLPVWKREVWADGQDWGLDARPVGEVAADGLVLDGVTSGGSVPLTVATGGGPAS